MAAQTDDRYDERDEARYDEHGWQAIMDGEYDREPWFRVEDVPWSLEVGP